MTMWKAHKGDVFTRDLKDGTTLIRRLGEGEDEEWMIYGLVSPASMNAIHEDEAVALLDIEKSRDR
jgi:hypothetical protein